MNAFLLTLALSLPDSGAVFLPAENVKWVQVEPEIFFAPLLGNPNTGAYSAFARFKAGHRLARHTHTADMRVTVLAGTMYYALDHGQEKRLGIGSFAFIPAEVVHTHRCEAVTECMILMEQPSKLDATVLK